MNPVPRIADPPRCQELKVHAFVELVVLLVAGRKKELRISQDLACRSTTPRIIPLKLRHAFGAPVKRWQWLPENERGNGIARSCEWYTGHCGRRLFRET